MLPRALPPRSWLARPALIGLTAALLARPSSAETLRPAAATQVLLRVLAYDASFASRGNGDFVVLVACERQASCDAFLAEVPMIASPTIRGRPLKFKAGAFADRAGLSTLAESSGAAAILAPAGTSPGAAEQIASVAESKRLYTLALDAALVERHLLLGVELVGGKANVVINSARAEGQGVRFEVAVLRIARLVR